MGHALNVVNVGKATGAKMKESQGTPVGAKTLYT